jgi:hypothetical protein
LSHSNPITASKSTAFTGLLGTPAISERSWRWPVGRSSFAALSVYF